MKLLLCVVLFTVGAVVKAQEDDAYADYWPGDYDGYDSFYGEDGGIFNLDTELKPSEASKPADASEAPTETRTEQENKKIDVLEDYQIEDNRSNSVEKDDVVEKIAESLGDPIPGDAVNANDDDLAVLPIQDAVDNPEGSDESDQFDDADLVEEASDDLAPLPVPSTEDNKDILDILEETKQILKEDTENFDEQPAEESAQEGQDKQSEHDTQSEQDDQDALSEQDERVAQSEKDAQSKQDDESEKDEQDEEDEQDEQDKEDEQDEQSEEEVQDAKSEQDEQEKSVIEETNRLLEETDDAFEADDYDNSDEQEKSEEDLFGDNNDEIVEETPQEVYDDLNADLDKLFATLDKLTDDNSEAEDEDEYVDNIQEYEDKNEKPYNEDNVLSLRASETAAEQTLSTEENKEKIFDAAEYKDENEADEDQKETFDYEILDDSNLSDIFAIKADSSTEKQNETSNEEELLEAVDNDNKTAEKNQETTVKNNEKEIFDYIDNFGQPLDREPNADDDIDSVISQVFSDDIKELQSYGNDALVDDKHPKNEDAEEIDSLEATTTLSDENNKQKPVNVDNLSSAELSDLMTQFVNAHQEDLDVHSEKFAKNTAPVHITLSVDEPVVITSPNFPNNYPTGNTIDWIFEGPGTGIEMNITDFAVTGARGDYLLVKPGGIDESGTDGLIFSYSLTSPRRYRFTDVSRMFVRFEATPGSAFSRGFQFSVKLMWPLPTAEEDMPVPEPVIRPPNETLIMNLAGLTLPRFNEVQEEFVKLVADMAAEYIKDNNIDPGLNSTLEVTQITKTAVCNIHWPSYETCVEVVFGVPLQYDEETEPRLTAEDLDLMWTTYIVKERFAKRLRALGITEYAIPNDRTVLMVWLVIAFGVVISMAMLAFALWRFSCFEDYTRMRSFSDADSIQNEKRQLDLYPTPHQALPPLYSENDYKWADDKYDDSTRVDLGGFANKSYVRDELFDLDSDEDAISPRDRKGVNGPIRDLYDV